MSKIKWFACCTTEWCGKIYHYLPALFIHGGPLHHPFDALQVLLFGQPFF